MIYLRYLILLNILIFNTGEIFAQHSLSQNWVQITPQFSTGDTSVDLSLGIFATKNIGWLITNRFDSVGNVYNKLFKTTDGGSNWFLQREYFNISRFVKIFSIDSLHCWILGEGVGTLLITSDGGCTWDSAKITNKYWGWPFGGIFFFNAQEGIAVNQYPWRTSDGGKSWTRIDTTTLLRGSSDIHFGDQNHGWVSCWVNPWFTDLGVIGGTTDGGYTWLYQGDTLGYGMIVMSEMYGVDAIDSNRAFAIGTTGGFYRTLNSGAKWNGTSITLSGKIFDVEFLNPDTGWVSGCCGRVWQTTDGGNTWSAYESGLNSDLRKVNVLHDEKVIYVLGTNNALLRCDLVTGIEDVNLGAPTNYNLGQNYPNPFNSKTVIEYSVKRSSNIQITIYNLLGEKLSTIMNQFHLPGTYKISWEGKYEKGGELPSGIYFYQLSDGSLLERRKMILLK